MLSCPRSEAVITADRAESGSPIERGGKGAAATAPTITPVAIGHGGGRWSCGGGGSEEHLVPEAVEAADKMLGGPLAGLLIQEGLAEFVERNALG